jgi:hypothetical protein
VIIISRFFLNKLPSFLYLVILACIIIIIIIVFIYLFIVFEPGVNLQTINIDFRSFLKTRSCLGQVQPVTTGPLVVPVADINAAPFYRIPTGFGNLFNPASLPRCDIGPSTQLAYFGYATPKAGSYKVVVRGAAGGVRTDNQGSFLFPAFAVRAPGAQVEATVQLPQGFQTFGFVGRSGADASNSLEYPSGGGATTIALLDGFAPVLVAGGGGGTYGLGTFNNGGNYASSCGTGVANCSESSGGVSGVAGFECGGGGGGFSSSGATDVNGCTGGGFFYDGTQGNSAGGSGLNPSRELPGAVGGGASASVTSGCEVRGGAGGGYTGGNGQPRMLYLLFIYMFKNVGVFVCL